MTRTTCLPVLFFSLLAVPTLHATDSVVGNWLTPTGSIVAVAPCGKDLCLTVAKVSPSAPADHDHLNPDKSLRDRPICGLRIGDGFKPDGPAVASGGHIYDPESGNTYSGKMERKGDTLKLRGYMGISLLGRTEVWNLTSAPPACK